MALQSSVPTESFLWLYTFYIPDYKAINKNVAPTRYPNTIIGAIVP